MEKTQRAAGILTVIIAALVCSDCFGGSRGGYPDLKEQLPLWLLLSGGHLTATFVLLKNMDR